MPFDAPSDDTTAAWTSWLDERRQRRVALAAASATSGLPPATRSPRATVSPATSERLNRLRQSAERLRSVEHRMEELRRENESFRASSSPATARTLLTGSNTVGAGALDSSLEGSRQMLEQVRRRLNETRERVLAATERIERNSAVITERTVEERDEADRILEDARVALGRTTEFAGRLEELTDTLAGLADSASTSPTPGSSPPADTSSSPPSLPPLPLVTSPSSLESSVSAAQTDSIRHTIRQLIVASRRVSAAIDRHRESVTSALAGAATPAADEAVPLLRGDTRLPVILPDADTSPAIPPSPSRETTSPNPSGLLLPTAGGTYPSSSYPLTTSPRPISPTPPSPSSPARHALTPTSIETEESYPGERAQLLRIARLQRDIASRADELRELRERGREIEREQRALDRERAGPGEAGEGEEEGERAAGAWRLWSVYRAPDAAEQDDEEGKEDAEGEREVQPARRRSLGSAARRHVRRKEPQKTDEERRREYEVWARCGR
ncbi:hypothetical protein JCM10207_002927 [Rhodosporidiobolus poonsookiae]